MKLKDFIKQLKDIADKNGDSIDVIMADNIPVVKPAFTKEYFGEKVVITDGKK